MYVNAFKIQRIKHVINNFYMEQSSNAITTAFSFTVKGRIFKP